MSKRSISYTKPEEPNFLKRIKQQAGYKEGPTVDTKREALGPAEDLDCDEEQPTIVVLQEGDLTAEEAEKEKQRQEKEAEEAPADLNSRIIFKKPSKDKPKKDSKSRKIQSKTLLSFDEEEEEAE